MNHISDIIWLPVETPAHYLYSLATKLWLCLHCDGMKRSRRFVFKEDYLLYISFKHLLQPAVMWQTVNQTNHYLSFIHAVEKQYNQQQLIWIRFRLSPLVVDSTGSLFLWLYMQAIRLLGILSEGFQKLLQEVSPGLWLQYGASAWNLTTKVKLVICFTSIKISQLSNKLKNL